MIINEPRRIGDRYVIEKSFFTKEGYLGLCIFTSTGNRCGYVGVTEKHALWEIGYDNLYHINVHGGLTFSGVHTPDLFPGYYFLGFDCGHFGDGVDEEAARKYGFNLEFLMPVEEEAPRSLNYVIKEVQNLSKQLTPVALMKAKVENSIGGSK